MIEPTSADDLRRRIDELAASRSIAPTRLHLTVSATVVLQMVPQGALKGGSSVRQRVAEEGARLSPDVDYARPAGMDLEVFQDQFADNLERGWFGFTAILKTPRKATPDGVPPEYLMDPFKVVLSYKAKNYRTVEFELGHAEIGSEDEPVERLGTDIVDIFAAIGLRTPQPVKVMTAEHQIVQKIHACTVPYENGVNPRAHDLVDIQILTGVEDLNYSDIARFGQRLFAYRKKHDWPPTVVVHEGWADRYVEACDGLVNPHVLPDVHDGAAFVNELIARAVGG